MRGSLLLLDTNVLLSASNEKRSDHDEARELFPATRAAGCHVAVCGQVLREYLLARKSKPSMIG